MSGAEHELSVSCLIDAPRDMCWRVWMERKADWFCPKPWRAEVIEEDMRPGGRSAIQMFGPDGEETGPMEGVFLEVVPGERVVTTDAYRAGWIPQAPFLTAIWQLGQEDDATRFTATARHWDAEAKARHEEMGFHGGWGAMMAQFKALCEEMAAAG